MFEPFHQADESIRRRYGGTGLGLAISRRFVEMHGGRIWLESEVGVGTKAIFTLPTRHVAPARGSTDRGCQTLVRPLRRVHAKESSLFAPAVETRPRIVVVEQGQALSRLIDHHLENLEPIRVPTLEEAVRVAESQAAVALCINETPTPPANGVRRRAPRMSFDLPILSCWVPERCAVYGDMGAQDYLIKPVGRSGAVGQRRARRPCGAIDSAG